jgi:hypothetical protein
LQKIKDHWFEKLFVFVREAGSNIRSYSMNCWTSRRRRTVIAKVVKDKVKMNVRSQIPGDFPSRRCVSGNPESGCSLARVVNGRIILVADER